MRKQICFIVELGPTAQMYYFKIKLITSNINHKTSFCGSG